VFKLVCEVVHGSICGKFVRFCVGNMVRQRQVDADGLKHLERLRAFSSEVDTGSRQENASKIKY
jgi:hypothetical protein